MSSSPAEKLCYTPKIEATFVPNNSSSPITREVTRAEAANYLDTYCRSTAANPSCDFFRQTFFSSTPKSADLHIAFQQNAETTQTEVVLVDTKAACALPEDPDIFMGETVPLHLTGVVQPSEQISNEQLRTIIEKLQVQYQLQDPTLQDALQDDLALIEHPLTQLIQNQLSYMNFLQFSLLGYVLHTDKSESARLCNFDDLQYAPSHYTNKAELSALLTFSEKNIARLLNWSTIQLGWAQDPEGTIAPKSAYNEQYGAILSKFQDHPAINYPTELLAALDPNNIDPRKLFVDKNAFVDLQADWIEPTSDNNFDTHWNAVIIALGLATIDEDPKEVVGQYAALKNSAQASQRGLWQNAVFEAWEEAKRPVAAAHANENQTSPAKVHQPQSSAAVTYHADTPL